MSTQTVKVRLCAVKNELFVTVMDNEYRVRDLVFCEQEDPNPETKAVLDVAWNWLEVWEQWYDTTGTMTTRIRENCGFIMTKQTQQEFERDALIAYLGEAEYKQLLTLSLPASGTLH